MKMSANISYIYPFAVFLSPAAAAAILYFVFRRNGLSSDTLIIVSTALPFFLLIGRGILTGIPIITDTVILAAGAAFLYFFFRVRADRLEKLSPGGHFSAAPEAGRDVPLRHILQMGVILEERGMKLYGILRDRTGNADTRKLCRRLAEDEVNHRNTLLGILNRWLPRSITPQSLETLKKYMNGHGILTEPPPAGISEKELAEYAAGQERLMADFYRSFESSFPESWKREHIYRLVAEEEAHLENILSMYPELNS
ncbi:MAG: ferritin family protein [Elusimicrobia bacterium]|nr:ferritin family protein [Elusimicrobiota bacterium]